MSRRAYLTPDSWPACYRRAFVYFPANQTWVGQLFGAVSALTEAHNWEEDGGVTAEQAAAIFTLVFDTLTGKVDIMFPGMITLAARETSPDDHWLPCDGAAYLIAAHPELYNAIGDTFGDDGAGTFRVPDLRGVFPLGASASHALATGGGAETHTLTTNEIPSHQHQFDLTMLSGSTLGIPLSGQPAGDYGDLSTKATGGGAAHNNMPPYVTVNFFIFAGGC